MIKIKEIITIKIELMDGGLMKIPSKDKDYYSYEIKEYGIKIFCNRLEEEFKDEKGDWRFRKELFIPFANIKRVEKLYEYEIEKQEVLRLFREGIIIDDIKKKLEENGVKCSKETLEASVRALEAERLQKSIAHQARKQEYQNPEGIKGCRKPRGS